jgi:hypothetical protein
LFSIICGVALASSALIWAITKVGTLTNMLTEVGKQVETFS